MTRGFWPLRDLPVVMWLCAVVVVALVHPWVPAPRWLMIHLLLLGAVSHAILVWSRHFTDALLHAPSSGEDRGRESARLLLLNAGTLAVTASVVAGRWWLTVAGAVAVVAAVGWHGVSLVARLRRALPARFAVTVRFYVAAAALLPLGATLGVLLARGLDDPMHAQARLAHAAVNLLGWMGLTVTGTLVTLWPTMLRTRMAEGTERAARRALPWLVASVLVAAGGALLGQRLVVTAALLGYLAALVVVLVPLAEAARRKAPSAYPTWSVLAGVGWLIGCLVTVAAGTATAGSWEQVDRVVGWATPYLAVGFGAQVLLGALSYLVPMALGGGPAPVRAANISLDRGSPLRLVLVNAGLLLSALPVPSLVRVLATLLVLGGLTAFVPLLFLGIRASRRARTAAASPSAAAVGPPGADAEAPVAATEAPAAATGRVRGPAAPHGTRPPGQRAGLAVTGLAIVLLAGAAGVALDPAALSGTTDVVPVSAGAAATGTTRTVAVTAADMRFSPARISVPAGTRLVIEVTNADAEDVHDLVLDSGHDTGRLAPGESATIDLGVVGRDVEGWCSVVGHRQMGMVLSIDVAGADRAGADPAGTDGVVPHEGSHHEGSHHEARDRPRLDLMASPAPGFTAREAALPPLPDSAQVRVHRRTFTVREVVRAVAPGVTQRLWTFNGSAPGPTLHGRVGDVFEITLVNEGTSGHSIDFHAGALAPDRPMRTIAPGASLTFRFRATRAGIWMYHCSSMPMSAHIANGMFGAVVIEPEGLPPVDRSYVLVQSELYLGPDGQEVDVAQLQAERPDLVVFNGYANQYDARPLTARTGERVRLWVLDAGPNRPTSFHVVGAQFDTVWTEGAYRLAPGTDGGAQVLPLQPAQGGFVELTFPEAGHYPFVSHVMIDAERGAHGVVEVTD